MEFFSLLLEILPNWVLNSELGMMIFSFIIALIFVLNLIFGSKVMRYLFNRNTSNNQLDNFNDEYHQLELNNSKLNRNMESPININPSLSITRDIFERLRWDGYKTLPKTMILKNTGTTVILQAEFDRGAPYLSGGNLRTHYDFIELTFKWGWLDNDGSEHMLNFNKFSLELQALHKSGPIMHEGVIGFDLVSIALFFDKSLKDNVYLNPICTNLRYIQEPKSQVYIKPFPLDRIIYPFRSGFYSYYGTFSDCPQTVCTNWLIYPDQFNVSARQLQEFRQLKCLDGLPMIKTSRLLKPSGQGPVAYECFNPEEEDIF